MRKFKVPKIKIGREMAWHLMLLVFSVAFVVIFALNVYFFSQTKEELNADVGGSSFSPLVLREDILDKTVSEFEKKQVAFENILSSKPDIKNPFPPEEASTGKK